LEPLDLIPEGIFKVWEDPHSDSNIICHIFPASRQLMEQKTQSGALDHASSPAGRSVALPKVSKDQRRQRDRIRTHPALGRADHHEDPIQTAMTYRPFPSSQ